MATGSTRGNDIFISYRRDGGFEMAKFVHDALTKRGYRVFLDAEAFRSGRFNTQLREMIDSAQDFIFIFSPGALDRCVNEEDWVREEILRALQQKKNIIPVIVGDASFPSPMPPGLDDLQNYQGVAASSAYFEAMMDKLAGMLKAKPHKNNRKIIVPIVILIVVILAGLWCLKYFL